MVEPLQLVAAVKAAMVVEETVPRHYQPQIQRQ